MIYVSDNLRGYATLLLLFLLTAWRIRIPPFPLAFDLHIHLSPTYFPCLCSFYLRHSMETIDRWLFVSFVDQSMIAVFRGRLLISFVNFVFDRNLMSIVVAGKDRKWVLCKDAEN